MNLGTPVAALSQPGRVGRSSISAPVSSPFRRFFGRPNDLSWPQGTAGAHRRPDISHRAISRPAVGATRCPGPLCQRRRRDGSSWAGSDRAEFIHGPLGQRTTRHFRSRLMSGKLWRWSAVIFVAFTVATACSCSGGPGPAPATSTSTGGVVQTTAETTTSTAGPTPAPPLATSDLAGVVGTPATPGPAATLTREAPLATATAARPTLTPAPPIRDLASGQPLWFALDQAI